MAHALQLAAALLPGLLAPQEPPYVPSGGEWKALPAERVSLDQEQLDRAIAFAREAEADTPRDLAAFIRRSFGHEPHSGIVGPTQERAAQNGIVLRGGAIVAEWGDTRRPDMTFSVTKTYLSTVVGLAVARGHIDDVHEPVARAVPTEHFASERHGRITWDHLLRQTSDWRGTLWGKPAWADRPPRGLSEAEARALPPREPGEAWEYNDVCVNLLALAALQVWREPLPVVLRREIMDPIGASPTWRWHGYESSWVTLDGLHMQSVSGGGHHGGGMFVSTRDQARFGLLMLRDGRWGGEQLVPREWIVAARTPTAVRPTYGYMNWFLNTPGVGRDGEVTRPWPAAPESAVTFRGAGANLVYLDVEHDLVVVLRWFDARRFNAFLELLLAAVEEPVPAGGR